MRALLVRIDQEHAAGLTLAVVDERLDERPEEAVDVGLADQQVQSQLHRIALDVGQALRTAPAVALALERLTQRLHVGLA